MAVVEWKKDENAAIISMNNGANRHNLAFAQAMLAVLDEIQADKDISSVILTSSDEKNFSQGIDVEWLMQKFQEGDKDSIRAFMYGMNDVFKKLLLIPLPVIAAINGHAFGNGAIITCACDFRFMKSDKGFFCFPEVDMGIPFLPGMIAFIKKAMPYYLYNDLKLTGRRAGAVELFEKHFLDKACPDQATLMQEAITFAKSFNKKRGIFGEHKRRLHKDIIAIMDNEDKAFIEPLNLMVND
jgi:enoyl-CoA hydratase/carnithine racemase